MPYSSYIGGDAVAFDSPYTVKAYDEEIVSIKEPLLHITTDFPRKAKEYAISLFPIAQWIYRYNLTWFTGDLIAGITVGVVVVPQSMSYAQIAGLPAQYGLYSSFVGVIIYAMFATSKDVTIGPVAVMSAETYKVVARVLERMPHLTEADKPGIASSLALICGGITAGLGLLRLGFLLEYISMPSVLGFMSGSAFTILIGQVPSLMGLSKRLDTRAASYLVTINTLKNLRYSNLDAAFGLVSLFFLFLIKYACEYGTKRWPRYKRAFFFASTLRTGVVIIFSTLIAWGVCRHHNSKSYPIALLKTVPRGLKDVGVHPVNPEIISAMAPELPIATIILLLEHIAIAKSFGRLNNYRINPNQELLAIGVNNLISHFFQAYPSTGSFSRTAIKNKAGVRTPLAGFITGVCVLVAIYGLTDAFYWISKASLSAVIIHAVVDLIASWRASYHFFLVSPVECLIFLVDILLCVFVSIESGIYFSVAASLVFLLLRISFSDGQFLGKIEYTSVNNPHIINQDFSNIDDAEKSPARSFTSASDKNIKHPGNVHGGIADRGGSSDDNPITAEEGLVSLDLEAQHTHATHVSNSPIVNHSPVPTQSRGIFWVPLSHQGINPDVAITPPPPGVFVYRLNESLLYPNVSWQLDRLALHIRKNCRPDIDPSREQRLGDRPWNDHGPRHRVIDPNYVDPRPFLRAIVIDLSSMPNIDLTAVTQLADTRDELNKYANRNIEWHFAGVISPWTRRALITGFQPQGPLPSTHQVTLAPQHRLDVESQVSKSVDADNADQLVAVTSTSKPFFHLHIPDLS